MTELKRKLIAEIATDGPLRLDQYMTRCLLDPQHGYYATRDPFGSKGDFTTSPEISQMFGEMLGLALTQVWMAQGRPDIVLAELGPGRGTLMADMLRVMKPSGLDPEVHLVEASATLRDMQRARLGDATWHDDASTLPQAPLFVVANEFFDALPIRQFIRTEQGWSERYIATKGDGLIWVRSNPSPVSALDYRWKDTKPGDLVELRPAASPAMAEITDRIETHGGAGLIIDYGDWRSLGSTFQALRHHKPVDPLAHPGEADLTAHVDFEALSLVASGHISPMTPQGFWLERLGITARAEVLAEKLDDSALKSHVAAHRRLTHPAEMGSLFKVIAVTPSSATPVPGFDA